MTVFKRQTSKGETAEYHYRFMQSGKDYHGVCEGCTTDRQAKDYEKDLKEKAKELSKKDTIEKLVDYRHEIITGKEQIALADAYSKYLMTPGKRTPGKKQKKRNEAYMRDFAAFMAKHYPEIETLRDVKQSYAKEYIHLVKTSGAFVKEITFKRQTTKKPGKELKYTSKMEMLSARTINARHALLKSVFERLKTEAGIAKNPFAFDAVRDDTRSRDHFNDEELKLIGENFTMPYTKPVFIIGLYTGLSLSDICLLKWSEIIDDFICTHRRKTGAYLEIPILPPLRKFLAEQYPITGNGEYVAPELAQMCLKNPTGLNHHIRDFLENLGIKTAVKLENRSRAVSNKGAHALRHTFASLAGVHGVPLMIVQSILGHMSPRMTELYQRHSTRAEKQRFLSTMPMALLGDVDPEPEVVKPTDPEREKLAELARTADIKLIRQALKLFKSEEK